MTVHNLGVEAASREGGHDGMRKYLQCVCVCISFVLLFFKQLRVFFRQVWLERERD